MIPLDIEKYCQERDYLIEEVRQGRKSMVAFLKKNGNRYVLKRLKVSDTEDITQKFKHEIECFESVPKMPNQAVKVPKLVDFVLESHFYVVERVEGISIHRLLMNPFADRYKLLKIHHTLFQWIRDWYEYNPLEMEGDPITAIMETGPYSKKMLMVLEGELAESRIHRVMRSKPLPISRIHGDLVPWNIILAPNDQIVVLDWANGGTDLPLHDVTRYLLQIMKQFRYSRIRQDIFNLFWSYFDDLFCSDPKILQMILFYHYMYSKRILYKPTQSRLFNLALVRRLRTLPVYQAYHCIDEMIEHKTV